MGGLRCPKNSFPCNAFCYRRATIQGSNDSDRASNCCLQHSRPENVADLSRLGSCDLLVWAKRFVLGGELVQELQVLPHRL